MRHQTKPLALALALALAAGVAACGGAHTTEVQTISAGQQLTDLKNAYDTGVISEKEYNRKRSEILKSD